MKTHATAYVTDEQRHAYASSRPSLFERSDATRNVEATQTERTAVTSTLLGGHAVAFFAAYLLPKLLLDYPWPPPKGFAGIIAAASASFIFFSFARSSFARASSSFRAWTRARASDSPNSSRSPHHRQSFGRSSMYTEPSTDPVASSDPPSCILIVRSPSPSTCNDSVGSFCL